MTLVKRGTAHHRAARSVNGTSGPPLRQLMGPERLTGLGFRCWLAGYQTGQIACWEQAWNLYARELGPHAARGAIRQLSCWVRAVSGHAQRDIQTQPAACEHFCHDECLAVSMIAAAQHDCPAIKACAYALRGAQPFDEVIMSASRFASVLRENRLVLQAGPFVEPLSGKPAEPDAAVH